MDIIIKNLNKTYENKCIFKNFNIKFEENKVNTVLGKSGCGKTTLLNIIADIIKKDSGTIEGVSTDRISYIFQEDRLIEWLTVSENIKLILRKSYDKNEIDDICNKYLELVSIYEHKNSYPSTLSGGMRQRVNIARAFANDSNLIIMDEPFKSLDIKNKYEIMDEFKNMLDEYKKTVIFITHDIDEALYFEGNIFIFDNSPVDIVLQGKTKDITSENIVNTLKDKRDS